MAGRQYTPQGTIREGGALPITRTTLALLTHTCDTDTVAGTRDRLVLELGYALPATRGQLAALRLEHIEPDIGDAMRVQLGDTTVICTHPGLVEHYQDWMLALAAAAREPILTGPVFVRVDRWDNIWGLDAIIPETVAGIVQRAVRAAKLPEPERYRPYSLTVGHRIDAVLETIPKRRRK